MGANVPAFVEGFDTTSYMTAVAGTAIVKGIPGKDGYRLALIELLVTCGVTAHTVSVMHLSGNAGQKTTSAAGAAAGQKDIVVDVALTDGAGAAIAASDIVAYQCEDGTWEFNSVTGWVAGTLTLTCANNLAKDIAPGGRVVNFGVVGDGVLFAFKGTASVQKEFGEGGIALVAPEFNDPLYVSDDNAANAGSIDNMIFAYINK